ncbi:hypothetical protein J3Q64DRAFT_1771328 [Phycomyces blakesleeanus]|uniref:Uncharacterized protein n=1 Tax=Phycomyces blakesleeanus TaxID=4837 RepID=A0ABR3ALF1_PHYBL
MGRFSGFKKLFTFEKPEKDKSAVLPTYLAVMSPIPLSIHSCNNRDRPTSIFEDYKDEHFMRDPTRCGSRPDRLGQYFDPMGSRSYYPASTDVTNTGA